MKGETKVRRYEREKGGRADGNEYEGMNAKNKPIEERNENATIAGNERNAATDDWHMLAVLLVSPADEASKQR